MRWKILKKTEISPAFFIFAAFLLLVLPLRLLLAAGVAAIFHEICHLAVIRLCGGSVYAVRIGAGGMELETGPMTAGRELLCAMAGPLGSLMLVLLGTRAPLLALCAGIQGIYNLLPLYPLDGGRVLRCALEMLFPSRWADISAWLQGALTGALVLTGIWLSFGLGLGILPILVCTAVLVRKIPCKEAKLGVQ